jgi:glycosyltransferase involved in cell wall biosynthesis
MTSGFDHLKTIVLVEPICRGSRLQILANTLSALKGVANVVLVTRRDYQSEHFTELVIAPGLLPKIVTANTDLGGAWMKNLSREEFNAFLTPLESFDADISQASGYDLVFMALDDYLIAFSTFASQFHARLRNATIYCIKYRVEYLFAFSPGFRTRGMLLRALTRWSLMAASAKLICFDERLLDLKQSYLVGVLPDPWFGDYRPSRRAAGRSLLGMQQTDFVLLTLGKQDRRKGLDFLIKVFPKLAGDKQIKLAVVGTISNDFVAAFDQLKRDFAEQIVHIDAFVDEADLPSYFAAADAFLLAYSKDFTATSGTLARAAASGVTALSSDHGLVGHRVRTLGLGETFTVGDEVSFLNAVQTLRTRAPECKQLISDACLGFSGECALPKFERTVRAILLN